MKFSIYLSKIHFNEYKVEVSRESILISVEEEEVVTQVSDITHTELRWIKAIDLPLLDRLLNRREGEIVMGMR